MSQNTIKLGLYRHYKKKEFYEVIGIAVHSQTLEEMVVYIARYDCEIYGLNKLWVRPVNIFFQIIEENGKNVPRFEYVGNEIVK